MADYYDTVLLSIPAVFVAVTAALLATGAGLTTAVPAASFPVLLVIGHAMFVRAPTDAGAPARSTPGRSATSRPSDGAAD